MHLFQIVALSLALVLVANSAPLNSSEDNAWVDATWTDFQNRHIVSDSGYGSWTRAQWNTLLRNRIGNSEYGSKSTNSFLIGTPTNIRSDIAGATLRHNKATNLWWSNAKYTVYVMRLAGTSYDAYRCPNLGHYFLAGVDTSKVPVHYDAQSETRPASGSLPLDLSKCVKVN